MASRKEWDPRERPHRFQVLERLASEIIGDGKKPDLFFVTIAGKVVVVTQNLEIARRAWEEFAAPMDIETSIEDRLVGTLASITPDPEEADGDLIRIENFDFLPD